MTQGYHGRKISGIESFTPNFFFSEKLKMCLQSCNGITVAIRG